MDAQEATKQLDKAHWKAVAAQMRILTQYPEWEAFTLQLGGLEANWLENMVNAASQDDYRTAQGFLKGLRTAASLPQRIIAKTETK